MKKTLFVLLTLLAALLVFVSCDESLDADVFNTESVDPKKSIPLTLEFPTTGTVTIYKYGTPGTIMYSLNGGEKTEAVSATPIEVPANGTISFYRTINTGLDDYNFFVIFCNAECYVYGNIMSLVDSVNYATKTTVPACAFYALFYGNNHIKNHESIDLVLSATTLDFGCYSGMFSGCTSLTTAPELPATTLADRCYSGMFEDCTSLTTAPTLPATTLAAGCYSSMFEGCTSLTTAPELPAENLDENCYRGMFSGCTSLTTAPALPAETLAASCYIEMFCDCTSLTTAPELPATTLANNCYHSMFSGCTSLTTAPTLPAITLAEECYEFMFNGCSSLNSITCLATDISATDCTTDWVKNVAATGTFKKAPSMLGWSTGDNGIPSGWTPVDAPTT